MKPTRDPDLIRLEAYPVRFALRTTYADMDAFRHINNGAIGRYFEEGRAFLNMMTFGESCMVDPADGLQLLFARVEIDFLAQVNYPGDVEVATAIVHAGTSSYTMQQALFQNGKCCALAKAALVKAHYGKPSPLSSSEHSTLTSYCLLTRS